MAANGSSRSLLVFLDITCVMSIERTDDNVKRFKTLVEISAFANTFISNRGKPCDVSNIYYSRLLLICLFILTQQPIDFMIRRISVMKLLLQETHA